jgi:hypothetical protein
MTMSVGAVRLKGWQALPLACLLDTDAIHVIERRTHAGAGQAATGCTGYLF